MMVYKGEKQGHTITNQSDKGFPSPTGPAEDTNDEILILPLVPPVGEYTKMIFVYVQQAGFLKKLFGKGYIDMNLIAAVDKNWGMGNKGGLLTQIPADMRQFKEKTTGKVVVMGRKTLETFPGGRPLPFRTNVVLTRDPNFRMKDAVIKHSLEEAKEYLEQFDSEDIFVIGGSQIYEAFFEDCDTAYITYMDYAYEADVWFPNLDQRTDWEMTWESEEQVSFNLEYTYRIYKRV